TEFFHSDIGKRAVAAVMNQYYGYLNEEFDYYDTQVFLRRMRQVLPHYEAMFREAGAKYGLPWTLLAAMAYQESHWDTTARSPTGVAGIMMLTEITAKALGVTDRTDPRQSIFGGARYYRRLYLRFGE